MMKHSENLYYQEDLSQALINLKTKLLICNLNKDISINVVVASRRKKSSGICVLKKSFI